MARNSLGKIRRSQNLSTFGVGSIIDFRTGNRDGAPVSVVAAGLEQWNEAAPPVGLGNKQTTFEPRLQARLEVEGFRLPPVAPDLPGGQPHTNGPALLGVRFPSWLQCPSCHLIQRARDWDSDPGEASAFCGTCTSSNGSKRVFVIPVRFIAACENGHLDEFPWHWWLGHKVDGCRGALRLKTGTAAGLGGVEVSCDECRAKRSMAGCFHKDALKGLGPCRGKRPWLSTPDAQCTTHLRGFQRGASNLYFPVIASALDIPPFADRIQQDLGVFWEKVRKKDSAAARRQLVEDLNLHTDIGMTLEGLCERIESRIAQLGPGGMESIRPEEHKRFTETPPLNLGEESEFEARPLVVPAELSGHLANLVQVSRLREVRALRAFTRIKPPDPAQNGNGPAWSPISVSKMSWLPAIEVRGEGIFIELDRKALADWERDFPEVGDRTRLIRDAYELEWKSRNTAPVPRVITSRFLLIHSLAHVLIRQLGLECGYSTASLRERIYVDDVGAMNGLLIYTATPDSDGTLGGLASQADPRKFVDILHGAIRTARWCSSDPLCNSGVHAFTEPTSGASCHACMLAPETSCEEFNRLLDRRMLVGMPGNAAAGFFGDLLESQ